ncbi:hypothetical protein [Pseudomonas gingeri]
MRLSDEQVARLEEAAALAGYKHLSTYMRDRLLNQVKEDRAGSKVDQWADLDRMGMQLDTIERNQTLQRTVLAIAVYLLRKETSQGNLNGLRAELTSIGNADELIDSLLPELAGDIARLSGED